jgi:hypothetical protein
MLFKVSVRKCKESSILYLHCSSIETGRLLLHRTAENPKGPVVLDGAQSGKQCAAVINKVNKMLREAGRITSVSVKPTTLAFSSKYSKPSKPLV